MASKTQNIANNKKAFHDYFIENKLEVGISLSGTEVKSIKQGKCSIKEAYVKIKDGQMIIYGMHISPYEQGNIFNKDPLRPRTLLIHKQEIRKYAMKVNEQGYTIVPLQVYCRDGLIKLEIALAKGKKNYDKRSALKEKDTKREIERVTKYR